MMRVATSCAKSSKLSQTGASPRVDMNLELEVTRLDGLALLSFLSDRIVDEEVSRGG